MKPSRWLAGLAVIAFAFSLAFPAISKAGDETKAETSTYMVSSPHTAEECLAALDEFAASGKNTLDNWYWGCMDGDHTGYEIVNAGSKEAALKTVPENLRAKAKATKLSKVTAEQVASFHKK